MASSEYGYGYGEYTGYEARDKAYTKYPGVYAAPPPEIKDPFSGSYEGKSGAIVLDMEVDLDKVREFSPSLNMLSGTLLDKSKSQKLWSGNSTAAHFRTPKGVKVVTTGEKHVAKSVVMVTLSNGNTLSGEISATFSKIKNEWHGKVKIVFGLKRMEFDAKRTSTYFREVHLDIDYTDKVIWPNVELEVATKIRTLDPIKAFEDAGIKLNYSEENGDLVEDPSDHSPWTKSDLYEVMRIHFDEVTDADSNIWCMMGTTPPDKRTMGFSFDRDGKHGFALFTGSMSFKGYDSDNSEERKVAHRKLLHYFVHECGHCLGLAHPFEKDNPDSLSWMNYAWRYDSRHKPGSFYGKFEYRFSDKELEILRHSPGKNFKQEASNHIARKTVESPYGYASYAPDSKAADDSSESDDESEDESSGSYGKKKRLYYEKPKRKVELKLQMREKAYTKGKLIDYEVRLKNVGKLAALIDSDLSVAGGNLRLYVSDPTGAVKTVEPFVRPIQSSYTSPRVLYTAEDDEGPDRYSEYGSIGEGKDGAVFDKVGTYTVRAQYSGGRYDVTSDEYTVEITEPELDDEEERDAMLQVSEMAELGGSSHARFNKALKFFENLSKQPVKAKKGHVAAMVALFDGMSKSTNRYAGRRVGKKRKLTTKEAMRSPSDLLKDSAEIISSYHKEGEKADNFPYSKLVLVRAGLYVRDNRVEEAEIEVNRLYADLLGRGAKLHVLNDIRKKWMKILKPKPLEEKQTSSYYQGKVSKVLNWRPRKYDYGEKDITGLGLGKPFSDFDVDHKEKGYVVYEMLKNKYEETQDVVAVMKYANGLQQGREANENAVKYAVRGFVVHTRSLKKLGIRYPEPSPKDPSFEQNAALTRLERKGDPQEDWMQYWRCDGDLNYHHSHWHSVYGGWNPRDPHQKRRGELFGNMHAQMLARYDAERESWGLEPVKALEYDELLEGYNGGSEFHDKFAYISIRVKLKLPNDKVRELKAQEEMYENALKQDKRNEYDANWSGGLLESCWPGIGGLHNAGHMCLSNLTSHPNEAPPSYMSYTTCAIRDPVFYRWHKRIDNLWQKNNDRLHIKIDDFKAPVTIAAQDITITSSETPRWGYQAEVVKTFLKKPALEFEMDDKLDHDPFYYHIKVKSSAEVKCTFRIFICPERHANDRRRWIEMDKFVQTVSGETRITRKDRESSVIKRTPEMYDGAQESDQVPEIQGWCECGIPYSLLLPRGTKSGEKYLLCVVVTNNEDDNVNARTRCGSMSYCGAVNVDYPDRRQMGYPFTNNFVDGDSRYNSVREALEAQSHIALKPFVIQNKPSWLELQNPNVVDESPPLPPVKKDQIWPNEQGRKYLLTDSAPRPSKISGQFEVYLYKDDIDWNFGKATIRLTFSGRGKGEGEYRMEGAKMYLLTKEGKIDPSRVAKVLVANDSKIVVPEQGVTSDPVRMEEVGDYLISFDLATPGCYFKASRERKLVNTTFQRLPAYRYRKKKTRNIYCVSKITL